MNHSKTKYVSHLGSDEEVNIHLYPIDGYTMDEYDFTCEIFCSSARKQVVPKNKMERVNANNYRVWVHTSLVGIGNVNIRVVAKIPNARCDDGYRDVVAYLDPNMEIQK